MKTFSKAIMAGMMIAISVMPGLRAMAQSDPKPAIVISMAPIKEQMKDIGYITDASGFGQMSFLIKMQIEQFLKGIDTEKPSGMFLYFEENEEEPNGLAFLPITNIDDFLNTVSQYAKVDEGNDFTTIIPTNGQELLMKQIGDYAYFAEREEMFENINSDPAEMVGDLPEQYNMGARIFAQRIPESMREMWLDTIEDGYNDSMGDLGGIPSEIQEKNFEMQMETFRSLINETEEVVIGFAADKELESMYFDMKLVGLDGSKMAEDSAAQQGIKPSNFAGLLSIKDALFTANLCGELGESEKEIYSNMIESSRDEIFKELNDSDFSDKELDQMESIVEDLLKVAADTVKDGRMDGGMVVTGAEKVEFAFGMQVTDAVRLEEAVQDLVKFAEAEPEFTEFVEFNLNSGKVGEMRLHEIVIQLADANPDMAEVMGDEFTVLLAVGQNEVFVVGSSEGPMELMKLATEPSDAQPDDLYAMQYNMYLAPMLELSSKVDGNEITQEMAEKLAESGKDRIRLDFEWIKNGIQGRLDIQDGVLELFSVAMQNLGGMGGGAEF